MPKYEATEMRAHLKQYLSEMNDLLTSDKSVKQYTDLCNTLANIQTITDELYTPKKVGDITKLPLLDIQNKDKLTTQYRNAIQQAENLFIAETTGPIGERMRSITAELLPLLNEDKNALDTVDVNKTPITLPELIGKAREQAVDLGTQKNATVGGNLSSRQHIYIDSGKKDFDEGYFTPAFKVQPTKDFAELIDRMEEKYPAYRPILDGLRNRGVSKIDWDEWREDAYQKANEKAEKLGNTTPAGLQDGLKSYIRDNLFKDNVIQKDKLSVLEQRKDYIAFFDELRDNMQPIGKTYTNYISDSSFLEVKEGANIDKRNLAMYRMSGLLGKPNLVVETRPMTVIQNGVSVTGTYMAAAKGTDLSHTKPEDPVLNYKSQVFENPAVFSDIAAMQALDYICGNTDRHSGNFLTRYEPKEGENAKLVGITLIDNDNSFGNGLSNGRNTTVYPEVMGVIGEDFYNSMRLMTKEQMTNMLADCELSQQEIDWAWERKEYLQKQIEKDKEFYKDKAPGYVEAGHLRLVPEGEWNKYSLNAIAKECNTSTFKLISDIPNTAKGVIHNSKKAEKEKQQREQSADIRRTILGIPKETEIKNEEKIEPAIPVGKVVGTGLTQEPDPLNTSRDNIVKLVVPPLSKVNSVGGQMNKRYLMTWGEGAEKENGFLTLPNTLSMRKAIHEKYTKLIEENPKYKDVLEAVRDVYSTNDVMSDDIPKEPPLEMLGLSSERCKELLNDEDFSKVWKQTRTVPSNARFSLSQIYFNLGYGDKMPSERADTRNVAMSDVGDILGSPNTLARSRVAQIECDGRIVDGVIMNLAKGDSIESLQSGNHIACEINKEDINEVYNTKEGLKSIADLQIIDFVCENTDRHAGNMMYQFEKSAEAGGKIRFTGVQGIDNDLSFGIIKPHPEIGLKELPALNDIQVISSEMWEKVNNPKTADALTEKLKENGLSEEEVNAAKERFNMIKDAVQSGNIRVVKEDEWAKGENTFEKLSTSNSSIFQRIHKVAENAVNKGLEYQKKPQSEKEALEKDKKELKFSECIKVDSFGENLTERHKIDKLKETAEKEFIEQNEANIQKAPEFKDKYLSGRDLTKQLIDQARSMYNELDAADPWYHGTSKQYKDFKKSCLELEKLAKKISNKLNPKDPDAIISEQDGELLNQQINKIKDCNAAYSEKKSAEAARGQIKSIGKLRLKAGASVRGQVEKLEIVATKSIDRQNAAKNPIEYVQRRLAKTQSMVNGFKSPKLHEITARTLYFKSLSKMMIEDKKNPKMKNLLSSEYVKNETDRLMKQPAFQKMVNSLSDKDLRKLTAEKSGEKLFNKFIDTAARELNAQEKGQKTQTIQKSQVKQKDTSEMVLH